MPGILRCELDFVPQYQQGFISLGVISTPLFVQNGGCSPPKAMNPCSPQKHALLKSCG